MSYTPEYAQREFAEHGETWLMERLSGMVELNTIFDIGSNIGQWTHMARSHHPDATIHTFEIIPEAYRSMMDSYSKLGTFNQKVIANPFGLLDKTGLIEYRYKPDYDVFTTTLTGLNLGDSEIRKALVMKGDEYVQIHKVDQIDFLKIDTEGAEGKVFKGFESSIRQGIPKIIQFEYSFANILDKWLLKDSYEFLVPYGYKLGKLEKDHIEFKPYTLIMENFAGPEYIAVHEDLWSVFGL